MSQELRGNPLSEEEMDNSVHGRINKDILEYIVGHPLSVKKINELEEKKERVYMQMCLDDLENYRLSEGAEELLDFLIQHNIPHTIASSSSKLLIDFYEKYLHIQKWFDLEKIVYNDNTLPGKPAPDIYLRASENIGLVPKDCIVVEDARSGIQAAHTAGIGYVIALGPKEKHGQLQKLEGVNEVITTLGELNKDLFYF